MACILHIETSTDTCSVAVTEDGDTLCSDIERQSHQHAIRLAPMADEALSFADSHAIPLDAVAVSIGPGSYTGLRIGLSTAKGICFARQVPLITVPTLKLMCVGPLLYGDELEEDALLCPMLDARRMEVYAAVYNRALGLVRDVSADIVTVETYKPFLDEHPVYFIGNGSEKCKDVIDHPNAHFIEGIIPEARNMYPLAEQKRRKGEFADLAYCEPYYLKDFIAGTPRSPLQELTNRKPSEKHGI